MTGPDTWSPIGDAFREIAERLEKQQRDKFERDCRDDYVSRATHEAKGEREHA